MHPLASLSRIGVADNGNFMHPAWRELNGKSGSAFFLLVNLGAPLHTSRKPSPTRPALTTLPIACQGGHKCPRLGPHAVAMPPPGNAGPTAAKNTAHA
ncbi:hypothetical protein PtA15_11A449 [Puccinia triticina]|uniref:DUF1643 domain-containing protein n=1 Tax=Puccinia triticina TaxID=208348 RepID=A0ABY7CZK5_9BASI|nr:uncharacterized protein PtA15_11A449 [Puccinia triticina]WAQ89758.1 hypothetical protein PtA15_11A449 [Puccinia triticina]WAR59805.1 hypothetical protein PtB15_11B446 [Puccinia triticina]